MVNLRDLKLRLRALIARRRVERDLHDELAFHVEREARKLIERACRRSGHSPGAGALRLDGPLGRRMPRSARYPVRRQHPP